ncbi:element excision factor XisH family protein [Runella sp. MFBS21]|uniref:element excision factor XisH family protein n=1 Tax=Runella TaxID=105 RepID=UPI0004140A1C|nr:MULTISPECIES: element excision factor XisH family protein [Runella]MDF7818335.1 element excision factor XisH family protein [Runella sp. MFBS21]
MAKDKYHQLVKKALITEGWTITHDPLFIPTLKRTIQVDLGAERLIGAEKGNQQIAIEIKSFIGLSEIHEFYKALGQFNYYQLAIEETQPQRILFLAVPLDIYDTLFEEPLTLKVIERYHLKIIVYNVKEEKIEKWIS